MSPTPAHQARWPLCVLALLLAACGGPAESPDADDAGLPRDASTSGDAGSGAMQDGGPDASGVDPCAADNGGCDPRVSCTSSDGAVVCGDCPTGYGGSGETSCVDIDECSGDACAGAHERCVNEPGTYRCECAVGYARSEDGSCADVDECRDAASCVPVSTCTNTEGSYECSPCVPPSLGDPKIACVPPPPMVRFRDVQARSLSLCSITGRGLPINYYFGSELALEFLDPMVESAQATLEVTVERDGATPLRAVITDIATGTCDVREDTHIRCRGMIFDIEVMLMAFNVISAQPGSGTVRVRYCSPIVPACSEVRMRVVVDEGNVLSDEICDAPPSLDPASDDGVAIDDLTSDTTPTFTVASAPGTTLTWYRDGVAKGTVVVGGDGIATFTDDLPGDAPDLGTRGYSVLHQGSTARSAARYVTLIEPSGE